MKRAISNLFILAVAVGGCAPVLVAGLIAHSSSTKNQKKEFIANFERNNTEREKAGLAPKDFCSEAYRFDPGWAASLPECARRVQRFARGDSTALFVQPVRAAAPVPVASDSVVAAATVTAEPTPAVAPAATTAPAPAPASIAGEFAVVPGAPYTITLEDGTLLAASAVSPSGPSDIKAVLMNGKTRYVGSHKVKAILDADGLDRTEEVLDKRKTLP